MVVYDNTDYCILDLHSYTFIDWTTFALSYWLNDLLCVCLCLHPHITWPLTFMSFSPLFNLQKQLADGFRPYLKMSILNSTLIVGWSWQKLFHLKYTSGLETLSSSLRKIILCQIQYVSLLEFISNKYIYINIFCLFSVKHRRCMDHRYRKYLKNDKEPHRFRGIILEIYKNIIWVHGPKVWLVLS